MTPAPVQPTRKLMNILYACANGKLPWSGGVPWDNFIPLCEGIEYDEDDNRVEPHERYILCCGHTLRYPDESSAVVGAGLMLPGNPDRFGRPTLTITKAGREFLMQHMNLVEFDG